MDWYSADFETTTTEPTRVWLWAICSVNDYTKRCWGTDISSFFGELHKRKYRESIIYFHNLKFDGNFIIWHLLVEMGFKWVEKNPSENEFTTLISHLGQFYEIQINFGGRNKIKIRDSLKKLPFSVAEIAKAFNLVMTKGEIDYKAARAVGYVPSDIELDYIFRDVGIVAQALKMQYEQGYKRMTVSADALAYFKKLDKYFDTHFPKLSLQCDAFLRKAYKGGWVFCNPKYQGKEVGKGFVLDVNSMYPWAMKFKPLPYAIPKYFKGEYIPDTEYPLYITHFFADFKLKENGIPSIQIKNNSRFCPTDYVTDSQGFCELTLTSVDFELLKMNYHIFEIKFIDGFMFRSATGIFAPYVDEFMKIKETSKGGKRTLAKLMQNGLSGKFAKNPDTTGVHPVFNQEKNCISYVANKKEMSDPVYVPVTSFITAWARWNIITTASHCYDRFLYADTDSLHLLGDEIPEGVKVDPNKLGYWKKESEFIRAKYLHAKCYVEDEQDALKITVAGLPKSSRGLVTFDNFTVGATYGGKLRPKRVQGGVVLVETDFTIKG